MEYEIREGLKSVWDRSLQWRNPYSRNPYRTRHKRYIVLFVGWRTLPKVQVMNTDELSRSLH